MTPVRTTLGAFAVVWWLGLACTTTPADTAPYATDGGDAATAQDAPLGASEGGSDASVHDDAGPAQRLEAECSSDPCYVSISGSGGEHVCGLLRDGSVRCWGRDTLVRAEAPPDGGESLADGALGRGHVVTPLEGATPEPVVGLSGVTQISVGKKLGACARTSDGAVYCWGRNEYGQLGRPNTDANLPVPTRVEGLPAISSVVLGGGTGCAIASEDGALYCWGAIASVERDAPALPPRRMTEFRPPMRSLAIVTSSLLQPYRDTIAALLDDGTLACLGGDPAGATSLYPPKVPVELSGVVRGFEFAYLGPDGLLRRWHPSPGGRPVPQPSIVYVPQPSSAVDVSISSGSYSEPLIVNQGTVLLSSGRLFRWGINSFGTLGQAPELLDYSEQPLEVSHVAGNRVVSFATTIASTCVSLVDGKVKCWGSNEHGVLGRGNVDPYAHPEAEEIR